MMHAFGIGTMRYCSTSFVRVALASLLGTLAAFGLNGAVLAAGACNEGPNLNAGKGAPIGTIALVASNIASVGT
jgi:hypothetical protein